MADVLDRKGKLAATLSTIRKKQPIKVELLFRLGVYLLLLNVAYVFLFPFIYMVITSIKTPEDLADFAVNWIPRKVNTENYVLAMAALRYWRYLGNSVFITFFTVIGHLIACSFIGYGFARYNVPGSRILFFLVILSLVVPVQTIIIPSYMVYSNLKWVNSYLPIILPTFFGFGLRGGLFIFIFRQFFVRMPYELEDAAKIDGCSFFRTFWNIVLPISQPALLVSAVLGLVWHWHDFYEPSIYLRDPDLLPLPSMIPPLFDMLDNLLKEETTQEMQELALKYNDAVAMAAVFVTVLPVLLVYGVVQRFFIQGIERTGLVE